MYILICFFLIGKFFECDSNDLEYYTNELIDLIRIDQISSFGRAFQLFDYVKEFKKTRKWGPVRRDAVHLRGGVSSRLFLKPKLVKKLNNESSRMPLVGGLKGSLIQFLDTLRRDKDDTTVKAFHGGNKPNILDVLVCGAIRSCVELDMMKDVRNIPRFEQWFQQINDEISVTACVKHE